MCIILLCKNLNTLFPTLLNSRRKACCSENTGKDSTGLYISLQARGGKVDQKGRPFTGLLFFFFQEMAEDSCPPKRAGTGESANMGRAHTEMDRELSKDMFKKIEVDLPAEMFLADNGTKSLNSGLHVVFLDNNMNCAA